MYPLPETGPRYAPPDPIMDFASDFYFRSIALEAGEVVGQHVHDHGHATFVGRGRVRGWKNGDWMGDKGPGQAFAVEAGAEHCYQALEDSFIACVHDEKSALSVEKKGL